MSTGLTHPLTSARMRLWTVECLEAEITVTRCLFCGSTYHGSAIDGSEWHSRHRLEAHPDIEPPKRRRTKGRTILPQRSLREKATELREKAEARIRREETTKEQIESDEVMRPGELLCSACAQWLPDKAFRRRTDVKDGKRARRGRRARCKECQSRIDNEQSRARRKARRQAREASP